MSRLTVIVPSRGRAEQASRMAEQFFKTAESADTRLDFLVDVDDPQAADYVNLSDLRTRVIIGSRAHLVPLTNAYAMRLGMSMTPPLAVMSMGDDHWPVTIGWDVKLMDAIKRTGGGIAYGNDLVHGEGLPTACAMSYDIVQKLGWVAPPCLEHMYCDNFWRALGKRIGKITYLPNVIIEHRHPLIGKGQWDETYSAGHKLMQRDREAYEKYMAEQFDSDTERLRNDKT